MGISLVFTDSNNRDFISLTTLLDKELHKIYGELQKQFDKFNKLPYIENTVVVYEDKLPIACGAYKEYNNISIELKRIFVKKDYRGKKLSKVIVNNLEERAVGEGYGISILETGTKQPEAVALYKSLGYTITENYPPYTGNEHSICMKKILT